MDYVVGQWVVYYNTTRSHMERGHRPPSVMVPEAVPKLDQDQIISRPYLGGLV